jgi:3-dehydroquinate synthase
MCYIGLNAVDPMKLTLPEAIRVRSFAGDYFVLCRRGILRESARQIARLGRFSSVHILSSSRVWRAVGRKVLRGIPPRRNVHIHLFDDAETAKTLATVEAVARKLVRASADRKSLLIAVGGGVVGDVVGFVAASYLRGVALVQVPTTVVAQVDSAIGGKTGVNLPEGKNLVGAFYPPSLVLVDPEVLGTLPPREFRGGLAEVIKYGVISDSELFGFLERKMPAILARDNGALEQVIRRSIEIKGHVVSRDERESGLREILNYGHTFAHALEAATHYRKFQHGEAVAWGMMCAALLGHETADTPANDVARIIALVRQIGPLPKWPAVPAEKLFDFMRSDKKAKFGKVRFVLSPRLGRAKSYEGVTKKAAISVLRFGPQLILRSLKLPGNSDD